LICASVCFSAALRLIEPRPGLRHGVGVVLKTAPARVELAVHFLISLAVALY
jgi:hypothetical protein